MTVPIWALIPFVLMLLAIAIGPIVMGEWWESNRNKLFISLILGVPTALYLCLSSAELGEALEHQMLFDYIPFIILLGSLFVVTGGIHIGGNIAAKPWVNTLFLAVGYVLSSFMGTTGAAMLLIRPLIQTNKERQHKTHTILFFIAAVANCGGLLTPLGDPPLFLLYLKGAHFTWFMNMIPEWAFTGCVLLLIYYIADSYFYKREPQEALQQDNAVHQPLHITGSINFLYLVGIVASVAFLNVGYFPAMDTAGDGPIYMKFLREIVLVLLIIASLLSTSKKVRSDNQFSWEPIIEVAALFLGIFATMTPALLYLKAHAGELGLTQAWQFVYATGLLSSFLDNAPTALAFHSVALGLPVIEGIPYVTGIPEELLKAISMGAVFFGAMTYIGNGPNFMVKSIAEKSGVKMPSFFGYMAKFSLIILLPVYIITQLLFL